MKIKLQHMPGSVRRLSLGNLVSSTIIFADDGMGQFIEVDPELYIFFLNSV